MTEPFETTFILFVDMLGFAALVEKEGDDLNELNPIFTGVELYSPSSAESLLGYRFINFHRCLNQARVRLQEMGAGTAIVFSDSAFFRIDTLENAIHLARTLMFELVTSETPVRMGLARGSYRMLRFLTDSGLRVLSHGAVPRNRYRPCVQNRTVRRPGPENPLASRPRALAG